MRNIKKKIASQFMLYLAVGGSNTIVTICVMAALRSMGLHYVVYTAMGYGVGFLNSYYWNSRLTFHTQTKSHGLLIKFLMTNIGLLLSVQTLQIFLIEFIKIPEIHSIIIGMAAYTLVGFGINRCLLTPKKKDI